MCACVFPSVMLLKVEVKKFHMCIMCVCVCARARARPSTPSFVHHPSRRVKIRKKGFEVLSLHPPPHPPQHNFV